LPGSTTSVAVTVGEFVSVIAGSSDLRLSVALLMIVTMHLSVALRQVVTDDPISYDAMVTNEAVTVSRRDRLRAQTLQEIEDASFAIIDSEGVHALSIAALARSMAMSAPAVYRYFPSRDALVAHLVTRCYQQLAAAMSQAAAGGGRSPRARVGLLAAAYRDWALRYRWRYGMLFGEQPGGASGESPGRTPLRQRRPGA